MRHRMAMHPGNVSEDIQATEPIDRSSECLVNGLSVTDVAGYEMRFTCIDRIRVQTRSEPEGDGSGKAYGG
jgi:hypothetical protein